MKKIKGQKFLTINATEDESYELAYETTHTINIFNYTDGTLIISDNENYSDDGTTALCIKLPANGFINSLPVNGKSTFLTSIGNGNIGVVRIS